MGLSLQHLLQYADEGDDMSMLKRTGDESWVHHCQAVSMHASMQWKHPVHLHLKSSKFKVKQSAGKVMLAVFWDSQGVLLSCFQKRGENMNSAS
jgi:hypothetical protein